MKYRVCILINGDEQPADPALVKKYLPPSGFTVTFADSLPAEAGDFHMIAPWNYRKIIPDAADHANIVVFHASNLPDGKGWAPIYHTFAEQHSRYVVTGIRAADSVDAGDMIVRAQFELAPNHTAPFIREVDEHLFYLLISKVLTRWPDGNFKSVPQSGSGTYRKRRKADDNEVDPAKSLKDLIPHLKGVEPRHPAFFFHGGEKFILSIQPETPPRFPAEVLIEYPATGETDVWTGWA